MTDIQADADEIYRFLAKRDVPVRMELILRSRPMSIDRARRALQMLMRSGDVTLNDVDSCFCLRAPAAPEELVVWLLRNGPLEGRQLRARLSLHGCKDCLGVIARAVRDGRIAKDPSTDKYVATNLKLTEPEDSIERMYLIIVRGDDAGSVAPQALTPARARALAEQRVKEAGAPIDLYVLEASVDLTPEWDDDAA